MRTVFVRAAVVSSWIACATGLAGCHAAPHDAGWFLAHGDRLHAELLSCRADPQAAANDRECAAATEAFVRWYTASGLAARDAKQDLDALDARLTPPASASRGVPAGPRGTQGGR